VATNPLSDYPGYLLRRASAWTMAGLAKRLEPLELTPTEASVLTLIASNLGVTQSEIGRMLGIVSANMTPLVARLDQRGLVTRVPVDGRSFGLTPTRRGAALAAQVSDIMREQEKTLIQAVSPKHRAAFQQALIEIIAASDE